MDHSDSCCPSHRGGKKRIHSLARAGVLGVFSPLIRLWLHSLTVGSAIETQCVECVCIESVDDGGSVVHRSVCTYTPLFLSHMRCV